MLAHSTAPRSRAAAAEHNGNQPRGRGGRQSCRQPAHTTGNHINQTQLDRAIIHGQSSSPAPRPAQGGGTGVALSRPPARPAAAPPPLPFHTHKHKHTHAHARSSLAVAALAGAVGGGAAVCARGAAGRELTQRAAQRALRGLHRPPAAVHQVGLPGPLHRPLVTWSQLWIDRTPKLRGVEPPGMPQARLAATCRPPLQALHSGLWPGQRPWAGQVCQQAGRQD